MHYLDLHKKPNKSGKFLSVSVSGAVEHVEQNLTIDIIVTLIFIFHLMYVTQMIYIFIFTLHLGVANGQKTMPHIQ